MEQGIVSQSMANPTGKDTLSPEAVKQNMNIPANLQNAFDRVSAAGMKIMFSKETNKLMLKGFDPNKVAEQIGKGVVVLMATLLEKSNNTIPPQIIIPVGMYLIAQAADFYEKGGLADVTNEDIATATQIFLYEIIQKSGGDPDQMMSKLGQFDPSQLQQMAQQAAGQQQGV